MKHSFTMHGRRRIILKTFHKSYPERGVSNLSKNKNPAIQKVAISAGFIFTGLAVGLVISGALQRLPSSWEWVSRTSSQRSYAAIPHFNQPFVEISKAATAAVVNISTVQSDSGDGPGFHHPPDFRHFFNEPFDKPDASPRPQRSMGSGVIVDPNGIIVTNHHVVLRAREIKVQLKDRRAFAARILGSDPKSDLAVLKIDADRLPTIPWGDSDRLEVGEYVLAVGDPFGFSESVTMGIVSALGRTNIGVTDFENFIQTDAAINPGNSGGALVSTDGLLVGINTAILSESGGYAGVGFAIPSNMARRVVLGLTKEGRVRRGWIGVTIQDLDARLAQQFDAPDTNGALVSDVAPRGPADRSGLHRGDVIVRFDGKLVSNARELRNRVAELPGDYRASVEVIRALRRVVLDIRIGESPRESGSIAAMEGRGGDIRQMSLFAGIRVHDLSPEIRRRLGVSPNVSGIVVLDVEAGSRAAEAGVMAGDIIQEMNHHPISDVETFSQVTDRLSQESSVLLLMVRKGQFLFAALSP